MIFLFEEKAAPPKAVSCTLCGLPVLCWTLQDSACILNERGECKWNIKAVMFRWIVDM